MEPYRDNGIPGWLMDGIDDAPPYVEAFSVFLLLALAGRAQYPLLARRRNLPGRLREIDLVVLGGLVLVYAALAWLNLDDVSTGLRVGLLALTVLVLAYAVWRTVARRYQAETRRTGQHVAARWGDGLRSWSMLSNATEISNEQAAAERVRELSRQYGLEVDPDAVIEKLPVGHAAARRDRQGAVPPCRYSDPGRADRRPHPAGRPRTL